MQTTEPKKQTQIESFILMLRGQKTRSEAHQLILLLTDNATRTKEENKQLEVLLKAERAKVLAKKAILAATKLLGANKDAERKERNHRLIQQGLLIDMANMQGWDKGELLGGLIALANTKITDRSNWKHHGDAILAKEKTPQAAPVAAPASAAAGYKTKRVAAVPTALNTRYDDKDEVKSMGAIFDADSKKWVIPAGHDLVPFEKWL